MRSLSDSAYAGRIPATTLGVFFALRTANTLLCSRWLGIDPQVSAAIQIILGLLLFALLCFYSLGAGLQWRSELGRPANRWVMVFLCFALASFAWSGAVSLGTSFAYWFALAIDVSTMVLLLSRPDGKMCAEGVLRGYIYGACVLAVTAWCLPVQEDLRLGDPDYFNTNQIGNLCASAFFFVQYLKRRRVGNWSIAMVILLSTLLRSLSKTTLIAMIVSQSILFLRGGSTSRAQKTRIIFSVLIAAALFSGLFATYLDIYTTTGNQAETLTGRTAIWAFSLDAALERPWFGNGFDALWHVMPPFGPDRFEARHAENEVLQQFFAYGLVGVVLLACIYWSVYQQVKHIRERPQRLVMYGLLSYTLVRGLAEAEPFDLLLPLWTIVVLSRISSEERSDLSVGQVSAVPIGQLSGPGAELRASNAAAAEG